MKNTKPLIFILSIVLAAGIVLGNSTYVSAVDRTDSVENDAYSFKDGTLTVKSLDYLVVKDGSNYKCVYDEPWVSYKNKGLIENIIIDADAKLSEKSQIKDKKPTTGGGPVFGNMKGLTSITVKKLNMGDITDISGMFCNNKNLKKITVKNFNISGVKKADRLFANNPALKTADLRGTKTGKLQSISEMFSNCKKLKSLKVSSWKTDKVKDFSKAFIGCKSLKNIDLSSWKINNANVSGMFYDCDKLSGVTLNNVNLTKTIAANSMFNNKNSLKDYMFASGWKIKVSKSKYVKVISDDCYDYDTKIGAGLKGVAYVMTIKYNKLMPDWYKETVMYERGVDGATKIISNDFLEAYASMESGDFDFSAVWDAMMDSLTSLDIISNDDAEKYNKYKSAAEIAYDLNKDGFDEGFVKNIPKITTTFPLPF